MKKTTQTTEAILKSGETTEFWQIICDDIDKDIKELEMSRDSDTIASLPAMEYKLAMENIKDKIVHLRALKNKPQLIIANLDNPIEEENFDPYD